MWELRGVKGRAHLGEGGQGGRAAEHEQASVKLHRRVVGALVGSHTQRLLRGQSCKTNKPCKSYEFQTYLTWSVLRHPRRTHPCERQLRWRIQRRVFGETSFYKHVEMYTVTGACTRRHESCLKRGKRGQPSCALNSTDACRTRVLYKITCSAGSRDTNRVIPPGVAC